MGSSSPGIGVKIKKMKPPPRLYTIGFTWMVQMVISKHFAIRKDLGAPILQLKPCHLFHWS